MATPQSDQIVNQEEDVVKNLKYLEFIHAAAIQTMVTAATLYGYAKENSGPLKPGVNAVEGTVKTVIGPVVDKYHSAPLDLLIFVDRKMDDSVTIVGSHVPDQVKEAYSAAQKAPEVIRSVACEVHKAGVVGIAKGVYERYEPVAEQYAVTAWKGVNKLPLVPQVVQIVVPTAACVTEKYNNAVCYGAEKGYRVSAYLPIVPTEKIAKVFGDVAPAE